MYGFAFVTEGAVVPEHCDKREGDSRISGNKLRLSPCDSYNHSPLAHVGGNDGFVILKYSYTMNIMRIMSISIYSSKSMVPRSLVSISNECMN